MSIHRSLPAFLLWLPVALGALATHAGDLYRTVDAEGHVTYSDHPLSTSSRRVTVQVTEADPAEAARLRRAQAADSAAASRSVEENREREQDRVRRQQQASQQKQQCRAARSRYDMFAAGGRIFHMDDQGNRVYYSDQEIQEQRVATKAAMDQACGTGD